MREQRRIGVIEILEQGLLDRRHVVHAFDERARQLLEACESVELERVEFLIDGLDRRHARLYLRFRLQLDLAYLSPQPDHAVRELEQVRFQRAQLPFDSGSRDGHFTCLVHQAIDDIRANAQHRARRFDIAMFACRHRRSNRRHRRQRDDGRRNRLRIGESPVARTRRIGLAILAAAIELRQRHIGMAFA